MYIKIKYFLGLGWDDEEVVSDSKEIKAEDVLEKGQMLEDGLLQSQIENSPMLQQFVDQLLTSQKAMKETVLRFVKESTFSTFETCATSTTNNTMSLPEVEYFESYDDLDIHADMLKVFF
jgi:hypothetical protein